MNNESTATINVYSHLPGDPLIVTGHWYKNDQNEPDAVHISRTARNIDDIDNAIELIKHDGMVSGLGFPPKLVTVSPPTFKRTA